MEKTIITVVITVIVTLWFSYFLNDYLKDKETIYKQQRQINKLEYKNYWLQKKLDLAKFENEILEYDIKKQGE